MSLFTLKPTHYPVKAYYAALAQFLKLGHTTEGNTRSAFADLLKKCCHRYAWHLVEEYQFKGTNKQPLRADGALVDDLTLVHGLWEAKDTSDDLQAEIKKKVAAGYPLTNILFQSPDRAVLYQDNRIALDCDLAKPENLIEILQLFFDYHDPNIPDWNEAVDKFSEKIPELAQAVGKTLQDEDKRNPRFREAFASFLELCRQSINPDLSEDAVRKMLIQHLLTVRIFTRVFHNEDFVRKNVIAAEIEKVIDTITARYFSRNDFLKPLDHFYTAIEKAAESQTGYTEKQHFLNAVYEKFFQRFDRKQADTHGIVYTPQPIVEFMVRSVEEILHAEFGKSLSDSGVHILDPFTGTGSFITRIIREINRGSLKQKYAEELHCNEIMLLPYYIASMNIEHTYMERVGEYSPFTGICLVDTFEMAESGQATLFTTENTARVKRQKDSKITVVIANPPYNAKQMNEGDENQNRHYKALDARVRDTYSRDSSAQLRSQLSDPYVKAFRWASDRIGKQGVVAYITNDSFLDQVAFDGMRKHLVNDFSQLLLIDLGGNVRKNPKLSGTTHNVFGIQVGVCISICIKNPGHSGPAKLFFARMDELWKRSQKEQQLTDWVSCAEVPWKELDPKKGQWLNEGMKVDWEGLIPLKKITKFMGPGLKTNRDRFVFNFSTGELTESMTRSTSQYESALADFKFKRPRPTIAKVIKSHAEGIKWSVGTKRLLSSAMPIEFNDRLIRQASYRPFTSMFLYFDLDWIDRPGKMAQYFPTDTSENTLITLSGLGMARSFQALATKMVTEHQHAANGQCFARYYFNPDGLREDNITDWALAYFRSHYSDTKITKWDIFHATYAILHHPEYRTRYAANLKRELPRIPFPPDFHAFAAAGKRLMELHIDYEKQPEYPLEEIEDPKAEPPFFRVERMKLSKDKSELRYNDFLLLRGIPAAAYDYRLGNRSALEWVIDQYRVSTDPRSGIVNDPNRPDDDHYILRLIGQVITVSVETQKIIASLPSLNFS
jgi:predicted helicase